MSPFDYALAPWRKYAVFSGRARRSEYWWFVLSSVVLSLVAGVIDSIIGLKFIAGLYGPVQILLILAMLVPSIAVCVRRLHDTNRTGWWMMLVVLPYLVAGVVMGLAGANGAASGMVGSIGLLLIVALIFGIVLFVFTVLDGTHGDNRFGPDPKAAERGGAVPA